MLDSITVNHEGIQYTWNGRYWYRSDNFIAPASNLIPVLEGLIPKELKNDLLKKIEQEKDQSKNKK
jgi:hypothetical protein